ncbi:hypothetical protein BVX94_02280 [bacterium B17]|nr:hypothetical protein BVX94_02280 [bacterium B17]
MNKLLTDRVALIRSLHEAGNILEEPESTRFKEIITRIRDDHEQFLSYSQEQPDKVSFALKPEHKLDNDRRTRTTLGRYLRRQLEVEYEDISDKSMYALTRAVFASLIDTDKAVSVISGDEIVEAYRGSVGGASCMTGENCDKIQIYSDNPDVVSMAVYGDEEARALLWRTCEGAMVLDRIYPNDGKHVDVMHNWAIQNDYTYRVSNSLPSGHVQLSDGKSYTVKLRHNDVFPYMDTFCFGQFHGGLIHLSNDDGFADVVLNDTCGGTSDSCTCCGCGENISQDHARYSPGDDAFCEECFYDRYTYCTRCDHTFAIGETTTVDETLELCEYCLADSGAQLCDHCDCWVTEGTTADDTEEFFCTDCAETELTHCVECEGHFAKDISKRGDGEYICHDCAEEAETCIAA